MSDGRFHEIVLPEGTSDEVDRVRRQDRLPEFVGLERDAEAILDATQIAIIGTGSVGANIALHSARLQVGAIYVADFAAFKPASLLTQPIGPSALGQKKASYIGRRCKHLSPKTKVFAWDRQFADLDSLELEQVDVVFVAGDNLPVVIDVSQRCRELGKPLLKASVEGSSLVAQVDFYSNALEASPCPVCSFTQGDWDSLNGSVTFSCHGGVNGNESDPNPKLHTRPTMSIAPLCSTAANLALFQFLRDRLGLGQPVRDTAVEFCAFTHRSVVSPLKRNPRCPCDHQPWELKSVSRRLPDCTFADLGRFALGDGVETNCLSFECPAWSYAERAWCSAGHAQQMGTFFRSSQRLGQCSLCGGPLACPKVYTQQIVAAETLGDNLRRPLQALGITDANRILVRQAQRTVLLREANRGVEEGGRS